MEESSMKHYDDEDGLESIYTEDLPGSQSGIVLYTKTSGNQILRKFRKEFPVFYHAIKALRDESPFIQAESILVRESGMGLLIPLLALENKKVFFRVSVWSAGDTVLERNMERNYLSHMYSLHVEGSKIKGYGDIAILVQERFLDQRSLEIEILQLLMHCSTGILYVCSHKKMGVVTLLEKLSEKYPMKVEVKGRGGGGSRVIKVTRLGELPTDPILRGEGVSYYVRRRKIVFTTFGSVFSPKRIDAGTDALIKYVLHHETRVLPFSLYDLGCGYGAIGISMAKAYPLVDVTMTDIDAKAIELANINVARAGVASRTKVVLSDGASMVKNLQFDLILSNPPLHLDRKNLIQLVLGARRRLKKNGRMLLVVEDSRVDELREIFFDRGVYLKIAQKSSNYAILEVTK
ncbi:hypothetical protein A3K34_01655 [candidate division WWE3 bacterium RIFOXYC1_FULL_40_10]|nr:MAG: hypothetical protein A3K58_01655 [candidate division WWE3 bacterium RIFOXYB1_FULL_40_22]OGC61571.1 MAG: hypothetical protein A3K37_01655 [candidate division WWE3 bacterium RIFOXYA1_FULL_40_11]OGC65954.1 MAG: hypothetical protein A3K34_01655 [candidate division WWE3 bacterium RIFOXYC1_FULL_40_10]OGC67103.1 MAG: hypothetical protein A2450_04465 [candidate division WWE3 bacterium RIFOXYC2_FULL_40_11]OGC71090.1 MAG: hypothetical protein A2602_01190 [candidate division WWE3 bacterium RIFOXYD